MALELAVLFGTMLATMLVGAPIFLGMAAACAAYVVAFWPKVPAMVVVDSVVRLLPGVLGNELSKTFESFTGNLLEYPQYTRPAEYRGLKVPEVLLSGNYQKIADWRQKQAHKRTLKRRPDLLRKRK